MRKRVVLRLIFGVLLSLSGALAGSYTVQPGDTAYSIAARFGISLDELLRRNGLPGPALRVGQVLSVPDNLRHTVARGETLYSIARRYNASLAAIRQANKLTTDAVRVGQVLLIPIGAASSVPNAGTVTVKPSPPPLPNLGQNNTAGSTSGTPGSTPSANSSNPASTSTGNASSSNANNSGSTTGGSKPASPPATSTVSGANLPPTNPIPTPPDALPRTTLTIPAPDPNNPFGAAKGQPIGPVPFRMASGAPVPDLGVPPYSPAPTQEAPANTSGTTPPGTNTPNISGNPTTPKPTASNPQNTVSYTGVVSEDPEILYSVTAGDTLFSIARRYGVTVNAIKLSNNLGSDALRVGQVLNIPVLTRTAPTNTTIDPILNPTVPPSVTASLREVSERYLGVTYRYGGSSADGLDCSGFVVIVFSELGIKLPRTSAQQFQFGQQVERADLRLGDLVFFNTSGQGVSHVGIYLSDGEFIHAASNPGKVMKSRLEERYYAQRYLGARRVITDD